MAAPVASFEQLPGDDPLAAIELLTDVNAVEFVATQLNSGSQNQNVANGAPTFRDLTAAIKDIVIETTVQGAGTLTVSIVDPWWQLLTRVGDAPAFVDVDESGLLIPVDVNFPQGTDSWWRLCAASPSTDTTQANLTLVFEDRIATELRDLGGPKTAGNNQDRAQFIASCVALVPEIRFVCPALTLGAGRVAGDLTQGQIQALGNTTAPASSTSPTAPAARRNPSKAPGIGRGGRNSGARWTPSGWRYTKPIDGLTPKELSILNPPTNQPDTTLPSPGGPSNAGHGLVL